MFCTACGGEVPQGVGAKFCPICGAAVATQPGQAAEPEPGREPGPRPGPEPRPEPDRGQDLGADGSVEITATRDGMLVPKAWVLALMFAVMLSLGFIGTISAIAVKDSHSPAVPLAILVSSGIPLVVLLVMYKGSVWKGNVWPLFEPRGKGYVVCADGIYSARLLPFKARQCLTLHPWRRLALYTVDERRRILTLKSGGLLIKMHAGEGWEDLKGLVLGHLANPRPLRDRPPGFRWVVLLSGIALLVAAHFLLPVWYEQRLLGPVGDRRCDVCGAVVESRLVTFSYKESEVMVYDPNLNKVLNVRAYDQHADSVLHEFCRKHAIAYEFLYGLPGGALPSLGLSPDNDLGPLLRLPQVLLLGIAAFLSVPKYMRVLTLSR